MPSKSKAQARFFAAAAHNPDFAKKAGMSTDTAKEWNQADKKAGTLKKGSKKPEHVKEEVLDEASGVGNFPVPEAAVKNIRKYASSVLLTYAYKSYQNIVDRNEDSIDEMAIKKILPYLQRFQKKYGAQVLDNASMKRFVNQSINLNLSPKEMFQQLPKSLQTPEVQEIINKMRIFFTLDANYGQDGSGGFARSINDRTSEIVLALDPDRYQFSAGSGSDGIENTMRAMQYFMSGIDHEIQHAFQQILTSKVSSAKDKNRETKPGYGQMGDAYYASGVEFGPQTQDLINAANDWLELKNDEGELSGKMNVDVSNAIKYALDKYKHTQGNVYPALRRFKEDDRAKKHMALIYKGIAKNYDNILSAGDHELDLEPKSLDSTEDRMYHSNTLGPDDEADKNDLMVKIYRAMKKNGLKPYHVEEDRSSGHPADGSNPYNKLGSMVYSLHDGGSVRFLKMYDGIRIDAYKDGKNPSNDNPDAHFGKKLSDDEVADMLDSYTSINSFDGIKYLFERIQHQADKIEIEEMTKLFPQWFENAKEYSGVNDPNKKLIADFDEGTLFFRLAGARGSWYIQDSHSGSCVLEDNETYERKGYIKYSNVEDVFTLLFSIYQVATERQFNRVMKNIDDKNITVESLENTWEYVQESSKAPVEESSMRSMMDLVQDAEIANGIDQAQKSTDVSRLAQKKKDDRTNSLNQLGEEEQLDEMPMRFDSFQGQDPDEFVDKTAQMTGKQNLVPFAEHDNFTVMRNKNYTGFIAFDKQGNQIAVVSGVLSQDAVLGVKNVFEIAATASKSSVKGVMYQIFMDMTNAGISVLSDKLHSDSAIKFWTRLIGSHEVYIVGGGEVLAKATPEKIHKYWSDDESSPSAELQLLLVG